MRFERVALGFCVVVMAFLVQRQWQLEERLSQRSLDLNAAATVVRTTEGRSVVEPDGHEGESSTRLKPRVNAPPLGAPTEAADPVRPPQYPADDADDAWSRELKKAAKVQALLDTMSEGQLESYLENKFRTEPIDPAFVAAGRDIILPMVTEAMDPSAKILSSACRSTFCRLEVEFKDSDHHQGWSRDLFNASDPRFQGWYGGVYTLRYEIRPDQSMKSIYLISRHGTDLLP